MSKKYTSDVKAFIDRCYCLDAFAEETALSG